MRAAACAAPPPDPNDRFTHPVLEPGLPPLPLRVAPLYPLERVIVEGGRRGGGEREEEEEEEECYYLWW